MTQLKKLQALQKITIQGFFDEQALDLSRIEKEFGKEFINLYGKFFHDSNSTNFKAESFGRQILITREIYRHFENFFKVHLNKAIVSVNDAMNSHIMKSFFKSEQFLFCKKSFPHYTGIGTGFENTSSFYFFVLENFYNNLSYVEQLALYTHMAVNLHFQSQYSDLSFYKNLRHGISFVCGDKSFFVYKGQRVELKKNDLMNSIVSLNELNHQVLNGDSNV